MPPAAGSLEVSSAPSGLTAERRRWAGQVEVTEFASRTRSYSDGCPPPVSRRVCGIMRGENPRAATIPHPGIDRHAQPHARAGEPAKFGVAADRIEIGRASCRERAEI